MVGKTKSDNEDIWGKIDEVEEKYSDLIEGYEGDDPRQLRHPRMKVTGASTRNIPRIQKKRLEEKHGRRN